MTPLEIREKLSLFFVDREGPEILENIDHIDLVDEGILDSLDFLSLAIYIEEQFNFKIDLTNESTFIAMRRFSTLIALLSNEVP